jgi:hypothetical protein
LREEPLSTDEEGGDDMTDETKYCPYGRTVLDESPPLLVPVHRTGPIAVD